MQYIILYIIHITIKYVLINFMLLIRFPVNCRLLAVKFGGSKCHTWFSTAQELASLTPVLYKGHCNILIAQKPGPSSRNGDVESIRRLEMHPLQRLTHSRMDGGKLPRLHSFSCPPVCCQCLWGKPSWRLAKRGLWEVQPAELSPFVVQNRAGPGRDWVWGSTGARVGIRKVRGRGESRMTSMLRASECEEMTLSEMENVE